MSKMAGIYTSPVLLRAGLLLLVLLCLLTAGCGKSTLSGLGPAGSRVKSGPAVAATAKSQIGRKYKYGGASPNTGFDCSGLIHWSYKQHGVTIPRQARDQAKAGRAVRKGQLQAGDIVVFQLSSRSGVHTGIYSGKGKFVHSPSSGKPIREDSLNSDYWQRRYVAGRRVL